MKTFIKGHFPRAYLALQRVYHYPTAYWKPARRSPYTMVELFCLRSKGPIRFVQIGANNGNDEFTRLRTRYGWTGVMVEPQRSIFNELVLRNQQAGILFEAAAIADRVCQKTLYKVAFSEAEWATTLASFDKNVIEKSIKDGWIALCAAREGVALPTRREDYYTTEVVHCFSLKDLMEKHRISALDILIVDTEGFDYEIIKQLKNLHFTPNLVIFEHKHLSVADLKACLRILRTWKYCLYMDESNAIAVHKSALELVI